MTTTPDSDLLTNHLLGALALGALYAQADHCACPTPPGATCTRCIVAGALDCLSAALPGFRSGARSALWYGYARPLPGGPRSAAEILDVLVDAARGVLRSCGYEAGEAPGSVRRFNCTRPALGALDAAVAATVATFHDDIAHRLAHPWDPPATPGAALFLASVGLLARTTDENPLAPPRFYEAVVHRGDLDQLRAALSRIPESSAWICADGVPITPGMRVRRTAARVLEMHTESPAAPAAAPAPLPSQGEGTVLSLDAPDATVRWDGMPHATSERPAWLRAVAPAEDTLEEAIGRGYADSGGEQDPDPDALVRWALGTDHPRPIDAGAAAARPRVADALGGRATRPT